MKRLFISAIVILLFTGASFGQQLGINIGNKAPDLIGKSPKGETFKLSETNGHLVLLDFWAGWCKACRVENPNVVNVYKKYKDKEFENGKGFTVFSVSLIAQKNNGKRQLQQTSLRGPITSAI